MWRDTRTQRRGKHKKRQDKNTADAGLLLTYRTTRERPVDEREAKVYMRELQYDRLVVSGGDSGRLRYGWCFCLSVFGRVECVMNGQMA